MRTQRRGIALAAALLLLVASCSDDSAPAQDAGGDGAVTVRDGSPNTPDSMTPPRDAAPKADIYTGPTWVGVPCTGPEQCASEGATAICLEGGEWGWPGGYCSVNCTVVDNVDPCPLGSHCEELTQEGPNIEACIKNCFSEADCEEGYSCAPVPDAPYGACLVF